MTRTKPAAEYPFRATLQRLRLKKKMTQQQLAEKLGVSPVTVSGWELGRRVPEPHTLSRIAQLFGTSVDNLLGYSKTAETFQAGDIAYVPMYGSVAMASEGIREGCKVLTHVNAKVNPGDICLSIFDKTQPRIRYCKEANADRVALTTADTEKPPEVFEAAERKNVHVVGPCIAVYQDLPRGKELT